MREFVSPPIHLPHSPLNLGIETRTLHHACELSDVKVQRILGLALARQVLRDQRSVLQQKIPPPAGDRRQEHRRLRAPEATPKVPRWIVQRCQGGVQSLDPGAAIRELLREAARERYPLAFGHVSIQSGGNEDRIRIASEEAIRLVASSETAAAS